MAGITTPFTTPTFPFLQESRSERSTTSRRRSCWRRPDHHAGRRDANRRPWTGGVRGRWHARVGLCAAVERLGAAGIDAEHGRRSVVSRIEDHAHRDSGQQHQSVDRGSTGTRPGAPRTSAEPILRHHSAFVVDRRPDDHRRAAHETLSGVHRGQHLSEQCRHDRLQGSGDQRPSAIVARADLFGGIYAFEADGHRLVRVRRVDSDGAADQRRRRRQPQSGARP